MERKVSRMCGCFSIRPSQQCVESCAGLSVACQPLGSESRCREGLYLAAISTLCPPPSTAYRCVAQVLCVFIHPCLSGRREGQCVIKLQKEHNTSCIFIRACLRDIRSVFRLLVRLPECWYFSASGGGLLLGCLGEKFCEFLGAILLV